MDRDSLRRAAKIAAVSSLEVLANTYAGDDEALARIAAMIEQVNQLIAKPAVPAVGMVVIGEAVAVSAPLVTTASDVDAQSMSKRPRREPPATQSSIRDYQVGECEVLIARRDDAGNRWNEYCPVVGHTSLGLLQIYVPGEDSLLEKSILGLGAGLGKETRPLVRACVLPRDAGARVPPLCATVSSSAGRPSSSDAVSAADAASTPTSAPTPATLQQPGEGDSRSAEEQLETSTIPKSAGRTREQLNEAVARGTLPGLSAKFGVPVVSTRDGVVSHLTFNVGAGEWNDLPSDMTAPFEWWLGEGKPRLSQASKIDPAQYAQPVGGVPLFFAVKRKKGGALCCYGGHWKTKSFDMCGAGALETGCGRPTFKDRRRQAIIRFAFDHFDAALGAAMNSIPDPPKNRPTTRQKPPRRTRGHPNP